MTTTEVEAYGRKLLLERAGANEARALQAMALATEAAQEGRAHRRHRQLAEVQEKLAAATRADAADSTLYLWLIACADTGSFYYVGNPCHAEGRRALKANWEGAPATLERLRPAPAGVPVGEWAEPEEVPDSDAA